MFNQSAADITRTSVVDPDKKLNCNLGFNRGVKGSAS